MPSPLPDREVDSHGYSDTTETTTTYAPPSMTADETKCVEACVAAIVSVFAESNKAGDEFNGMDCDRAVDSLAAIACQVIRRGSPLPGGDS